MELAGLDSFRTIPGYGTMLWSGLTFAGLNDTGPGRYIQTQRVVNQVTVVLSQVDAGFVFAPNNAQTWSQVNESMSSYLRQLWVEGALLSGYGSAAYQVLVGLGTTMTNTDILNGDMNVQVSFAVTHPGEYTVINDQQQLG